MVTKSDELAMVLLATAETEANWRALDKRSILVSSVYKDELTKEVSDIS